MLRTKAVKSKKETKREKENKEVAYKAALEGIVLLENENALPITNTKIALFGAGAKKTIKGGTGSGEVNERHSIGILEGLQNEDFEITTMDWIEDYDKLFEEKQKEYSQRIRKKLSLFNIGDIINIMSDPFRYPYGREITDEDIKNSSTDTCIYVVSRQAGEGADRKLNNEDNNLSKEEIRNIAKCAKMYEKTIVVINVGSTFDMNFTDEIEGINAVVFFCQQGSQGGRAFADLISGKKNPSGKITDTWAIKYEDIPFSDEYSYLNNNLDNEYYKEGIYVGYRYFDSFDISPKYEFGFGLSYTNFNIEFINSILNKTVLNIEAKVQNIGEVYSGKEVFQVYASCPQNKMPKEYQRLVGFVKTDEIEPLKKQDINIDIDLKSLASYDERKSAYILEKGEYILRIGNSSRNTKPCTVLILDEDIIISKHKKLCAPQNRVKEIKAPKIKYKDKVDNIQKHKIDAKYFTTKEFDYKNPQIYSNDQVDEISNKLTQKDMIDLVVGSGMLGGKHYFTCPGAVGNTTSKLTKKGIINIPLSDGPAGLRLQKTSEVIRNKKVKMIDAQIEFMNHLPKLIKKFIFGDPESDNLVYQFTTAFPVELALAQTWNVNLLKEVGEAISREMTEYGVAFWLGPALNIHRNPLCGRNFEYYSEDPYLSGKMAAAVTKGCQKTDGNYVTLKHFCANNQEDNRNKVSSNINERTLREIYLKGFEIAVKEADAKGMMTSYNKLNGTYTSNSHDLCTSILRNEWGFNGVVMTDWFSTGKNLADNSLAIKAGNDLIMPGGRSYKKEIKKGLKEGKVTKEELKGCAINVLKSILNSQISKEYML